MRRGISRFLLTLSVCLILFSSVSPLFAQPAPVLGVSGQTFTVNGVPKFLTFLAYFGAKVDTDATIRSIFQTARAYGFDGVRVFPNWWLNGGGCHFDSNPLFLSNGTLNAAAIPKIKGILDMAYQEGLLVDLSLAIETVQGLQFPQYTQAIGALAAALSHPANGDGYRHVFFDLQNEYGNAPAVCSTRGNFSDSNIAELVAAVRANDQLPARFPGSRRLVTASRSGVGPNPGPPAIPATANCPPLAECQIVESAVIGNVDIVADHDWRAFLDTGNAYNWWDQTYSRVANMKLWINYSASLGLPQRPVYQQEPAPECWTGHCFSPNGAQLLTAVSGAKQAGAAAWTFHNEFLFRWASKPSAATAAETNFFVTMSSVLATVPWNP